MAGRSPYEYSARYAVKKPFYKKAWPWVVVAFVALLTAAGIFKPNADSMRSEGADAVQGIASEDEALPEKTREEIAQSFVDAFNGVSPLGFQTIEWFNPKDRGAHYRTEYRLAAWDNSVGISGSVGVDSTMDVVVYGPVLGDTRIYDNVRVYVHSQSNDERVQILRDLVAVFGSGATDEVMAEIIEDADGGYSHLEDLGLSGYMQGAEFMLEDDPYSSTNSPIY